MNRLLALSAAPLALSVPLSAPPALAQEAPFALDEIVVSGAFTALAPQPLERTGATVELLEGAALEDSPQQDLAGTLDTLPGVSFSANGGPGSAATVRVRGLSPSYLAVRIDGIDVTDPSVTQTFFDFGGVGRAGLGRVAVIKGSQSALYGSEAIAGVIDITTARAEAPGFSGRARAEAGSFESYSGTVSLTQRTERGQLSFNADRTTTEGISARSGDDEKDGFQQSFATLTGDFEVSDTLTLGFSALWRDAELEIDRSATDNSGETFREEAGARAYAQLDAFGIAHELSYSAFSSDRRDPGGFVTEFLGDRREVSYVGTGELGATILSFGADWTEESVESGSVSADDVTASVFGEAVLRPSDRLDLALSLRHDDSDDFGGQTTGRLALAWQAAPDTTLRAVAGTGFRAPSLFERFSAFGDPELEPEESRSFELGLERRFGAESFVKATAFYTEIDELIEFDPASAACGSGFGCYAQVAGTTTTSGLELSGRYALAGGRAALFGAYTFTEAEGEEGRLPRVPRHDLVLGVEGRIAARLTGRLDVRHVADVEPSEFAPADSKVGDYTLANLGLDYALTDRVDATLRVENLTDEDYETAGGFNRPGRAAYVGLSASF
jgi:vitamin B12 transporter